MINVYIAPSSINCYKYFLCKVLSRCHEFDSRGVEWQGDPYERVNKSCNEGNFHDDKFVEGTISSFF